MVNKNTGCQNRTKFMFFYPDLHILTIFGPCAFCTWFYSKFKYTLLYKSDPSSSFLFNVLFCLHFIIKLCIYYGGFLSRIIKLKTSVLQILTPLINYNLDPELIFWTLKTPQVNTLISNPSMNITSALDENN